MKYNGEISVSYWAYLPPRRLNYSNFNSYHTDLYYIGSTKTYYKVLWYRLSWRKDSMPKILLGFPFKKKRKDPPKANICSTNYVLHPFLSYWSDHEKKTFYFMSFITNFPSPVFCLFFILWKLIQINLPKKIISIAIISFQSVVSTCF